MESTIRKSSGDVACIRKLFKIQLKPLKNTCYGVNFYKSCGKEACIFPKIRTLLICFTNIKPR